MSDCTLTDVEKYSPRLVADVPFLVVDPEDIPAFSPSTLGILIITFPWGNSYNKVGRFTSNSSNRETTYYKYLSYIKFMTRMQKAFLHIFNPFWSIWELTFQKYTLNVDNFSCMLILKLTFSLWQNAPKSVRVKTSKKIFIKCFCYKLVLLKKVLPLDCIGVQYIWRGFKT